MTKPAALPVTLRKRANPDWGKPFRPGSVLATEFEVRTRELHLTPEMYVFSSELRSWCERNRNRCYVPEWLLEAWNIPVETSFSGMA